MGFSNASGLALDRFAWCCQDRDGGSLGGPEGETRRERGEMARRLAGLCVVALLAVSVFGASAHAAEVGECLKTVKNAERHHTGHYIDKGCTAPATKLLEEEGKANKYEWSPGVKPENALFTAKTKAVELVGAAGTIACMKSSTVGEWTSATTGTEQTTFEGCEFKGGPVNECHSAGQAGGVIVTNPLSVKPVGHGETGYGGGEPAEGEAWEALTAESGPAGVQEEYLCADLVEIRTSGSVAGVLTPASVNVMAKKAELEFNGVLGQEPGKFGEQDLQSEASIGGGPFEPAGQGILKTTAKIKNSGHKIEIRA